MDGKDKEGKQQPSGNGGWYAETLEKRDIPRKEYSEKQGRYSDPCRLEHVQCDGMVHILLYFTVNIGKILYLWNRGSLYMERDSRFKRLVKSVVYINDQIDTDKAAARIKSNIWFRGPNVWILAFSVIIASVGLNVNSTAVIIGAMLISPLMGPIIGVGLALGTNDMKLLSDSAKNLLVMVVISLMAAFIYFLLSPLNLVNPTELVARTRPSIYDVLIAFFGGLAGILESSRKERGTVLSGVAIATALMPPLCTAGYGLAKGNLQFFSGAMFLFLINCVFIILATWIMVKYLSFKEAEFSNPDIARKTRSIMTLVTLAVVVPSIWSAVLMVDENNFERNVRSFVQDNKNVGRGYIYDYKMDPGGKTVQVFYAGNKLTDDDKRDIVQSASKYGIESSRLSIIEQDFGSVEKTTDRILKGIYERTENEIERRDARISELEKEVLQLKGDEVNYPKLAKEIRFNYPEIKDITISKGATVDDSLRVKENTVVIAYSNKPLQAGKTKKIEEWIRLRLEDSTAVVHNIIKE